MKCPSCSHEVAAAMKFCGNCGLNLVDASVSQLRPKDALDDSDRRPITIMFCDLVGSTQMSENLDPEELQDILGDYQRVCSEVVQEYGGYIAQYLGDGILAYFGYPHAHEDDACRAVHAGLGIVTSMALLNSQLSRVEDRLRVRIGIHTGVVVTGQVGHGATETLALGHAPNIAARIQGMTNPDTVAISSATRELTDQHFACESLGMPAMKGISTPIEVFQVLRATEYRDRIVIADYSDEDPIGRAAEQDQLVQLWECAKSKERQIVLLSGEAGIGKSRLAAELGDLVQKDNCQCLVARCSAYATTTPFSPLIELLEHHFAIDRSAPDDAKRGALRAGVERYSPKLEDALPIFCSLLNISMGPDAPSHPPDQFKQLKISYLVELLKKLAEYQPLFFVIEDIHWADSSTLDFLQELLTDDEPLAMLGLFTHRSSFEFPWNDDASTVTRITLKPLPDTDTRELINNTARPNRLSARLVDLIADNTDGNPLFAQELTKMLLESDQLELIGGVLKPKVSMDQLSVPKTLHSSLVARLDKLGSAKRYAQMGAVLGREFSGKFIGLLSGPADESKLGEALDKLKQAQILAFRSEANEDIFTFRHALFRDAAYDTLLKKQRSALHSKAASVLVEHFPDVCETRPELVADHFTGARIADKAVEYWQRAGNRAVGNFANAEAAVHFAKGLDSLARIPRTDEVDQLEITMQTALGGAISLHEGWQSRQAAAAFEKAYELCQQVDDPPHLFWVLWQLAAHYTTRDIKKTGEIGKQLIRMAERAEDPTLRVEAQFCFASYLLFTGAFEEAAISLESASALFDNGADSTQMSPTGQHSAANVATYLGFTQFIIGETETAFDHFQKGQHFAEKYAGPPHLSGALCWQAFAYALLGDSEKALRNADQATALGGVYVVELWARMLRGWALAGRGNVEESVALLTSAADDYRNSGIRVLEPWMLTLLADGLLLCKKYEDCVGAADEALQSATENGQVFSLAEAHRIKAEALAAAGLVDEAYKSFDLAVSTATAQGANFLLLKATLAFAKVLAAHGDRGLARTTLDETFLTVGELAQFGLAHDAKSFRAELA